MADGPTDLILRARGSEVDRDADSVEVWQEVKRPIWASRVDVDRQD